MAGVCKKKIYIYMSHSLLASLFFKQRVRKKIDLKYIPREPRVLSNRQYFMSLKYNSVSAVKFQFPCLSLFYFSVVGFSVSLQELRTRVSALNISKPFNELY